MSGKSRMRAPDPSRWAAEAISKKIAKLRSVLYDATAKITISPSHDDTLPSNGR